MNILVIGTGYVGLMQSAGLAKLGHNVFAVDIDKDKVEQLKQDNIPFFEPDLADLVKSGIEKGKLTFSCDMQDGIAEYSDAVFLCLPTPPAQDGGCNTFAIEFVISKLHALNKELFIVIKSTIPPGIVKRIEKQLPNTKLEFAANPEFLREGKAVQDFFHPSRMVFGVRSRKSAEIMQEIYQGIKTQKFVMSVESAQLSKYAANTMLASRLSLINELAVIADLTSADIQAVEEVLKSDDRIGGKFLRAGAGFGGSCFPKDVLALAHVAQEHGFSTKMIQPIIETNKEQPKRFVKKIEKYLGGLHGKKLAVWGLSFNKDTDDIRESPAIAIVEELILKGSKLTVFDPAAMEEAKKKLGDRVKYVKTKELALVESDVLCVLTEWDAFATANWLEVKNTLKLPIVFDGKNFLPRQKLSALNLEVCGMGFQTKLNSRRQTL